MTDIHTIVSLTATQGNTVAPAVPAHLNWSRHAAAFLTAPAPRPLDS